MGLRAAMSGLVLIAVGVGCDAGGSGGSVPIAGDWIRVDHPSAWFVSIGDRSVTLENRTLGRTVRGSWTSPDSVSVELTLAEPRHGLPGRLELRLEEREDGTLRMLGSDGEPWVLVRYGSIPSDLAGRWLTLPRNDSRYFIQFDEPNDVLWRRRFGMRRSEDRVGRGWTREDSLFLHIWGAPPMHYLYEITGDTLQLERPGIGPFGRYVRAPSEG